MRQFWCSVLILILMSSAAFAQGEGDFSAVAKTLGRAGKLQDGVYKVSFPRTDLKVRVGETTIEPGAGLGVVDGVSQGGER